MSKRTDFPASALLAVQRLPYATENLTSVIQHLGFYIDGRLGSFSLPARVWAKFPVRMVAKNASVPKGRFAWEFNEGK